MNPGSRAGRLIEQLESAGEIEVWIDGDEARNGQPGDWFSGEDGGGARVFHFGRVFRIGEEGQLGGRSMLHAGDTR